MGESYGQAHGKGSGHLTSPATVLGQVQVESMVRDTAGEIDAQKAPSQIPSGLESYQVRGKRAGGGAAGNCPCSWNSHSPFRLLVTAAQVSALGHKACTFLFQRNVTV